MNLLRMHVPVNFWLPKHERRQTLRWFIMNHLSGAPHASHL